MRGRESRTRRTRRTRGWPRREIGYTWRLRRRDTVENQGLKRDAKRVTHPPC